MKMITRANAIWLCLYVALMATIGGGLYWVRTGFTQLYQGAQAQEDWDAWRQEAIRQRDGGGPVKRRKPKSDQPPILVLMDEHFAVCVTASVVLGSALFLTTMFFLRGTWRAQPLQLNEDPPCPASDGTEQLE